MGDHLGFTAGVVPEMITPVVIGKLVGGVLAIALAILMTKDLTLEEEQSIKMKKDAV